MIQRNKRLQINGLNRFRGFELVKDAPEDTKLPVQGSELSAGYDFFAPCDIIIPPKGCSKLIQLNIKAYCQKGEYLAIEGRSSLALVKARISVIQGEGVIDADYYNNPVNDGNIGVMFVNWDEKKVVIKKGDRCCQGIFKTCLPADKVEVLGTRTGGYGSTGER